MEQFDLFDKFRIPTGEVMFRGMKEPQNRYRQVVHVVIFNLKGEMLIQQRQKTKKTWPNMWDISIGGGIVAGETPNEAATRELKEELGIDFDFSNLRPSLTFNFNNGFDDYFIIKKDIDVQNLTLQDEEVQGAEWASLEKIKLLTENNKFIPYKNGFMELLFNLKDNPYGAIEE